MKLLKNILLLSPIIIVALFLRTYHLSELMSFIPDQGWFYLSARDMLLTGQIPLVGPPTSHPWIHHGALWTYTLGILLWLFNFDPIAPAYFIAFLGVITVVLYYIALKIMYSKKVAILCVILFATSPLIVMNSRIPYHTSPIPFFVILLFLMVFFWMKGRVWFFPVITFLLGVLYNHEITTFVYAICVLLVLFFGMITKKSWASKLWNKKIIFASFIGGIIPMLPFIIYDIQNGYHQTAGFLVWMIYRVVKLPLSLFNPSFVSSGSNPSTISEFLIYYTDLFIAGQKNIAIAILLASILGLIFLLLKYKIFKKIITKKVLYQKFPIEYILLALFLGIGLSGLFVHRVPIEADTLLVAPFLILLPMLIFSKLVKNFYVLIVLVLIFCISNAYFLLSTNFYTYGVEHERITHKERMQAVGEILQLANGQEYSLTGRGELSDFPVFTMPYEYLLWWKGNAPTKGQSEKVVVWEKNGDIIIYRENHD